MAAAENVSEDGAAALPIKEAIPSISDGTNHYLIDLKSKSQITH